MCHYEQPVALPTLVSKSGDIYSPCSSRREYKLFLPQTALLTHSERMSHLNVLKRTTTYVLFLGILRPVICMLNNYQAYNDMIGRSYLPMSFPVLLTPRQTDSQSLKTDNVCSGMILNILFSTLLTKADCILDGSCCPEDSQCCNVGSTQVCAPSDAVCCETVICPSTSAGCCGDSQLCAPPGSICCGDELCPPGSPGCCGDSQLCAAPGTICCGTLMCSADTECCDNNTKCC
jgi:hypothetical protein